MDTHQLPLYPHPTFVTKLANGLEVITMQTPTKLVRAQLSFRCGAMHFSVPGAAHLLEHLLYEGPARQGMHPLLVPLAPQGVVANARTYDDHTEYRVSGHAKDADRMLNALLEMGFRASFTPEMLQQEKGVIAAEMLQHRSIYQWIMWRNRLMYPEHPTVHHTITGTPESLQSISWESLMREHAEWYCAGHTALVVCGDVAHEDVLPQLSEYDLPGGTMALQDGPLALNYTDGTYATTTENPPSQLTRYFRQPNDEAEQTLLDLALEVICDHPFSLLHRALRNERAEIYLVTHECMEYPFCTECIAVECERGQFPVVEEEASRATEAVCAGAIPEDAFRAVIGARVLNQEVEKHEVDGGQWAESLTDDWLDGTLESNVDHKAIVQNATPADLSAVAQKYLANGHGTVRVVWDER